MRIHWPRRKKVSLQCVEPKPELLPFEQVQKEFNGEILDVDKLRRHISGQHCPMCGEVKMSMAAYEKGIKGWECAVICDSCLAKGIYNDSGFRVALAVHVQERRED